MDGKDRQRYRAQLPRLSGESGTGIALIIRYFQQAPLDLGDVSKELINNAYLVRAMRYLDEHSVDDTELVIKPEAWKNIWYFWGVIESICAASGIDSMDVLERLRSQGKSADGKPEAPLKVSDLAALLEQDQSDGADGSESEDDLIRQRRENVSSVFGN
jgi:hypothetical protein